MPLPIIAHFKYTVTVERFVPRESLPRYGDEVLIRVWGDRSSTWEPRTVNDCDGKGFSTRLETITYVPAGEGGRWRWAETDKNGTWREDGPMTGEAGINALNVVGCDLPVALLEHLRGSRATRGLYRIGEAKFLYSGDDVERVE